MAITFIGQGSCYVESFAAIFLAGMNRKDNAMEHDKKVAKTNKQALEPKRTAKDSEALRDDELNSVTGGSSVSDAIKGIGQGLTEVARKG